ncbi:hypothetical protein [Acidovorax sp. BL-A-41-H1]|uniref:hypothetical protein n=1 Tax=Acidovorax sp. BL-A-41-H1 TaxID=3421102 RepID=UPI003F7AC723
MRQSELAKALGLSKQAVSKLKGQGMPVHSVEAARAWRDENLSVAARKETREAVPVPSAVPVAPPRSRPDTRTFPPLSDDEDGEDEDFKAARTREKISEANMAEMNEAKMRREMINVAVVERQLATDYATTRDALLQIPARIAPLLAAETDTAAIQTMLDAELHQALANLAGTAEQAKNAEGAFD